MSLMNKRVELTADQVCPMSHAVTIRAGESGVIVWDEPQGDVIVEFKRAVPNGGFLRDDRQAWIPRCDVVVVDKAN